MDHAFFDRDAVIVARALIGMEFRFHNTGGIIVETEAYLPDDPASHSFNGLTDRNRVMFGPPAHLYVYRSYGIHWCANLVCSSGSAVLLRALEPVAGTELMRMRRETDDERALCSGPGKLCQALGINGDANGLPALQMPVAFSLGPAERAVITGPRIGISKAMDHPWRFGAIGSRFLSKPFKAAAPNA